VGVSEEDWLARLQPVETWFPPDKPALIIAPHPDDETLGAGGLIASHRQRGIPVTVVAVTDGEAAYVAANGLAETRRREQDEAVRALGVDRPIHRLALPDSAVAAHETELECLLAPLVKPDMLVLAPWLHDFHPDHEACGRAAQKVCESAGAELVFYLFWTWHRRSIDVLAGVNLCRVELDAGLLAAKQAALCCHRSQLAHHSGEPILPESLLAPARRNFEIFISLGGADTGVCGVETQFDSLPAQAPGFFEAKYKRDSDPWDFANSQYEQRRYAATLAALQGRYFERAFEPGCSIGVLTAKLAPFCGHLHATDVSPTAVESAKRRCAYLPNVEFAVGSVAEPPPGCFDLIVLSELGYYFKKPQLFDIGAKLVQQLNSGGIFLAVHWLGVSPDHLLSGDDVHGVLNGLLGLHILTSERYTGFRIDQWTKQ
jgi:LmbE family N-acetylglucosaminyl deacetylase